MSTKTKLEKPEEIVKIFDDPNYIDRYELVIDGSDYWEHDALCCSPNPESPQGVGSFGKGMATENESKINWNEVPEKVQKYVIKRLKGGSQ